MAVSGIRERGKPWWSSPSKLSARSASLARPGAEASTGARGVSAHSFPPCQQASSPGGHIRSGAVSPLPSIAPPWSLVLALSLGFLPQGSTAGQPCAVGTCWQSREPLYVLWPTEAGPCEEVGLSSRALTPRGCLWSSLPSLCLSEIVITPPPLDSVHVSSLNLQSSFLKGM